MKTYTLIILCFFITTFSFSEVAQSEKEALLALYNSTNGEKWNHTWNLNEPIENWYGVTVQDNKVVEINLHF
ncbi:MAG: Two component regulator three Y domain protein, partial [Winogradskyella sp.]|nr:Two component regulator three Y domain protein [Winogradskyella sp.]